MFLLLAAASAGVVTFIALSRLTSKGILAIMCTNADGNSGLGERCRRMRVCFYGEVEQEGVLGPLPLLSLNLVVGGLEVGHCQGAEQ